MSDVNKIIMRFPVEDGTPRMFVAFLDPKKGVSVQDVDNDVVIAKGILKGAIPSVQVIIEGMLQGVDWNAFSRWITTREQYVPPMENYDVGQDRPNPGNPMAQIRYTPQAQDWVDARTPAMIAEDGDLKSEVTFPPASLEDMARSIAAHDKLLDPSDGKSRIFWTIPVDGGTLIGPSGDGEMTDPDMDDAWDEHAVSEEYRDEVLAEVSGKIFESDTISYNVADDGTVTLESYRSLPMNFGSMAELMQKCKGMKETVVPLYADIRRVDAAMKKVHEMIREITLDRRQTFESERSSPAAVDIN